GRDGRLSYAPDKLGNRIPDFSHAGYMGGGVPIPNDIPVRITLKPSGADDSDQIEKAVEQISALPPDARGYRGAILLEKGRFTVSRSIEIHHSGIVLRGKGCGLGGTVVFDKSVKERGEKKKHGAKHEKAGTITVGRPYPLWRLAKLTEVLNDYVPCGQTRLKVADVSALSKGQTVFVVFRTTAKFIDDLGLTGVWRAPDPGNPRWSDIHPWWERTVAATDQRQSAIVLDRGIPCSMDVKAGHGSVTIEKLEKDVRVEKIGIEDICFISDYDRSRTDAHGCYNDMDHAMNAVMFNGAKNGWMRRCVGFFYARCMARMDKYARSITIEDCAMLDGVAGDTPKRPWGGWKYYFDMSGHGTLVQRCYARYARHAFVNNGFTAGNVALDCVSEKGNLACEAHQRYQNGSMYDNVVSDAGFGFSGTAGKSRHGMCAVYCMLWTAMERCGSTS
ncbi:MAG: hypothetical protein JXR37_01940, partial [Kiritimatiellae bacterium]|nr:hypothetical protein [Kiritimatiellia bacterium]